MIRVNFSPAALCVLFLVLPAANAQKASTAPTTQSVEDEVLRNILSQKVGARTVAEDSLPESFLRRVADRIIRATYQQRFRSVVDDRAVATQPGTAPAEAGTNGGSLSVSTHRLPPERLKQWQAFPQACPLSPDFRAPLIRPPITAVIDSFARFRQTLTGFLVSSDAGEGEFKTLRVQLTRGDYWLAEGDGGSVDVARQLLQSVPQAAFVISIEQWFLGTLAETTKNWREIDRIKLIAEPLECSQWARDNAVVGSVADGNSRTAVTLVPRFASRGEIGSTFVPGDSLLMEGFAAAGHRVVQSPLLFQGGNLIAYRDPATKRLTLLIGEAEIYRNVALGLSRDQVLDAFRVEFGVDRCIVLPAVSYHIDYEVSVRIINNRAIAFVNDTPAAARAVFDCGLAALERAKIISPSAAAAARAHLQAGRIQQCLELALAPVFSRVDPSGLFPLSFAEIFSTGRTDSPVGNLRRFLLACDLLAVESLGPNIDGPDPNTSAYLRSLARRESDRAAIRKMLSDAGLQVIQIPSLSDEEQSINYLNGLHDRTHYLMPAHGGLFAPLDRTAAQIFAKSMDTGVSVVPIGCAESLRRDGAIRCSVGAYTQP